MSMPDVFLGDDDQVYIRTGVNEWRNLYHPVRGVVKVKAVRDLTIRGGVMLRMEVKNGVVRCGVDAPKAFEFAGKVVINGWSRTRFVRKAAVGGWVHSVRV